MAYPRPLESAARRYLRLEAPVDPVKYYVISETMKLITVAKDDLKIRLAAIELMAQITGNIPKPIPEKQGKANAAAAKEHLRALVAVSGNLAEGGAINNANDSQVQGTSPQPGDDGRVAS